MSCCCWQRRQISTSRESRDNPTSAKVRTGTPSPSQNSRQVTLSNTSRRISTWPWMLMSANSPGIAVLHVPGSSPQFLPERRVLLARLFEPGLDLGRVATGVAGLDGGPVAQNLLLVLLDVVQGQADLGHVQKVPARQFLGR